MASKPSAARPRSRLLPQPGDLDDSARIWMVRYARKNFWRVAAWYDLDDLIQDGYMCWAHICRYYCNSERDAPVTEIKHLMSLFKRAFSNHVHQLANKRSAGNWFSPFCGEMVVTEECVDLEDPALVLPTSTDADAISLAEAPPAVRKLIDEITQHPELVDVQCRRQLAGRRQTTNEWLCSIVGLDPTQFDLRTQLMEHLKHA